MQVVGIQGIGMRGIIMYLISSLLFLGSLYSDQERVDPNILISSLYLSITSNFFSPMIPENLCAFLDLYMLQGACIT